MRVEIVQDAFYTSWVLRPRPRLLPACLVATLAFGLGAVGCSSADVPGSTAIGTPNPFAIDCSDALDDVYIAPITPSLDKVENGAILRCAYDTTIDAITANEAARAQGYAGAKLSRSVDVFRIAYRTEHVGVGGASVPALSSALVFVPEKVDDAHLSVVTVHGTEGLGAACAPSLADQTYGLDVTHTLNLAVAASGHLTIAPDLAGYGDGATTPGWLVADDEAAGVLDATAAMKALLPAELSPERVAIVGSAAGGHAALAAQAKAEQHGHAGKLVGVAALAPYWFAPRTWGSYVRPGADVTTADDPLRSALTLLYFYTHGELYDGPGAGVKPNVQDALQVPMRDLVTRYCIDDLVSRVHTLGEGPVGDVFTTAFAEDVGKCGETGVCGSGLGATWNARFVADRPALDAKGAPVLVWQGTADALVTPDLAACGRDAMIADLGPDTGGALTYCSDAGGDGASVVPRDVASALAWIDALASGGPAPPACPGFSGPVCPSKPPND